MRKVENAIVASVAAGDMKAAQEHLQRLLLFDRRRAWWAVLRVAAAQPDDELRKALTSLVGKAYIARRTGGLVGIPDQELLKSLIRAGQECDLNGQRLTLNEQRSLEKRLPTRLARSIFRGLYPNP